MESAKILIVEDDQFAADKLQLDLIQAGHQVVSVVDNASECVNYIQTQAVDIVIVDIVLSGHIDGIDAATEVRRFSDVAIIYLTAHESDDFIRRAECTRPIAYLLKPHRPRELDFLIRMTLERSRFQEKLTREKEEVEADLWYQATFDSVTGLPSRSLLNDRLNQIVGSSQRQQRQYMLMVIGLDNFKRINESYGSVIGDKMLYQVGQRISSAIRVGDTLSRLHADVFAVLMEIGEFNQFTLNGIAEKILQTIAKPIDIQGLDVILTACCGISMCPQDSVQADELLSNAEAAMFKAKAAGITNHYRYYSQQMTMVAFDSMRLESELRKALERLEFELYYQPQINAKDNSVIGAEALIRWNHPQRGVVSPGEFIQLAEDTGLILPIGVWVLRQACHQMQLWQKEGLPVPKLSINISNVQFTDKNLISKIRDILDDSGCNPELLEFEITESSIMQSVEESAKRLKILRDLGAGIAVDDFGTGYSSLSCLKRLPISRLKIDYSFIHDIPDDENDAAIVRAIIALSKGLGLKVIAEGVETIEQLSFLLKEECLDIQGYLFSKPLPREEFEDFIRHNHLRSLLA